MKLERLSKMLQVATEFIMDSGLRAGVIHDKQGKRFIVEVSEESPLELLKAKQLLGVMKTEDAGEYEVWVWWRGDIQIPTSRTEMLDSPLFPLLWLFSVIE